VADDPRCERRRSEEAERTTPGILGIYSTNSAGKVQGGTAFLVSSAGDIVTAYHVVQGATAISLQEPSRGAIETTGILVRAVDAQRDLAVLTIPALANRRPDAYGTA